jgi:hypothetical protein
MHHEILYYGDEAEKEDKAIEDCRVWLGKKQFRKVMKILIQGAREGVSEQILSFGLMMQGIQGYSAGVLIKQARDVAFRQAEYEANGKKWCLMIDGVVVKEEEEYDF